MIMENTKEANREELIQRINELQRENKYLRDENSIYRNETISKSVIRDKIQEIENSGIWITEDCFFDGETDNLICQQEFKKYEMEEYIINLLRKLLGDE